jgi:3-oxoacyl-[acyl-carrier protein] reductase
MLSFAEKMLEGKVALVTGAAQGIGQAIAFNLAAVGAKVVINDFGQETAAAAVVDTITQKGGEALAIMANVADRQQTEEMIKQVVGRFGRIDILVNNAGITRDGLLATMSESDWDLVLSVNLKGAFNCSKAVIRPMIKARGGRIISISSVSGLMGNAGQTNYAASKAGLIGFSKSLARETASRGITVNVVAPGLVDTHIKDHLTEEAENRLKQQIPLGRLGLPEDIAAMVTYLASPMAGYITGQVIAVDGGMAM